MSLGQALLRPQGFKDAPEHGPSRAFDILVGFVESLIQDQEGGPETLQALIDSGLEIFPAFLVSRQEKVRLAEGRIRQLVRPFNDILQAFLAGVTGGVAESLPAALRALRALIAQLRADSLARFLKEAIHLARHDLDVNPEALTALFRSLIAGAATRLQSRVDGGDLSEVALKRYELGLNLRNLEHLILDELEWPDLDLDVMAESIAKIFREKGIDAFLAKISKVLEAAEALGEPLAILLETAMEARISGGGSVGAAARGRSVGAAAGEAPPDETTVTPTTPFSWYASWVLHTETRWDVTDASTTIDPIGAIQYRHIRPIHMERIAFHTLWVTDMLETVAHLISIEKSDIASNTMNMLWDAFNTVNTPVNKLIIPGWMQWTFTPILTLLGGLEGIRCSGVGDGAYPWIQIAQDLGETSLYRRWTWMMREFLLSFLTLLNHKKDDHKTWFEAQAATLQPQEAELLEVKRQLDASPAPSPSEKSRLEARKKELEGPLNQAYFLLRQGNHNQFGGFMYGLGEIGAIILPVVLSNTDRMNYGFAGQGPPGAMIGKIFGGMAINWGFRGVSVLLSGLIAWELPSDHNQMLVSWMLLSNDRFIWNPKRETTRQKVGRGFFVFFNFIVEILHQLIYLYLFTNGNTSGGTFAALAGTTAEFPGYPPGEGSPYLLPWNAGRTKQCVQNPMGIWSHFPGSLQTYAYDFDHDAGDEVLCSREGVVLNMMDLIPNNQQANSLAVVPPDFYGGTNYGGWNFIELLHLAIRPLATLPAGSLPAASTAATAPLAVGTMQFMPSVAHPLDPDPFRTAAGAPAAFATYTDGTTGIFPGTRFPPVYQVTGAVWPLLPTPMPLHPSMTTFFSGGAAAPTNCTPTADLVYSMIDTGWDRGLVGITFPAGSLFADGATPIPAGVVFAPNTPTPPPLVAPMYRAGTTFAPWQGTDAAAILTPPVGAGTPGSAVAAGARFLDGVPIPAGVELPPDCGAAPAWLPAPHPGTPLYLPGTLYTTIAAGSAFFNAGTAFVPVGTVVPPLNTFYTQFTPVVLTVAQYGHAIQAFAQISTSPANTAGQPSQPMIDVFNTRTFNQILGRVILQGRVLMLSGDTGVSFYNHLHHHVLLDSAASRQRTTFGPNFPFFPYTVPFVYADGTHGIQHGFREAPQSNGLLRAMTFYESNNTRTGP